MNEFVLENKAIPIGWSKAKIKDLAIYVNGKVFKPSEWSSAGRPIIRIQNLTGSSKKLNRFSGNVDKKFIVHDGDVLISWSATLGVFIFRGEESILNQHIFKVKPLIEKNYIYFLILNVLNELKQKTHGSGMQHITKGSFENHSILLPPLSEQKRIVFKIESIFTQIDTKQQELERIASQIRSIPDSFAELKSSILKRAFEGRLVPQDPDDEPAEILLKRIYKGSEKDLNFEKNDHLPKGWIKAKIGAIIEPSKEKLDPQNSKNRIFIGLKHIESNTGKILGKGDSKNTKSTKSVFRAGDILYGKLRPYLNKVCIPDFDGVCSTDILVFIKNENFSCKYVSYFLSLPKFVRFSTRNSNGVQHPRIKFNVISKYQIPFPPLNEQKRIVSKIESIFTQIDTKQQELERIASQIRSVPDSFVELKSSVLKRAFEGRLVPQDPDDEPASVLLERIKRKA